MRVPSKEEEQLRSITRQRQSLIKERSRNTNRRRSYALYYGVALKGIWWAPRNWKELEDTLSDHLVQLLKPLRALILVINEQIRQVEAQLNQMESVALPKGMGTVLFQQTEREVGDWGRFDSSKQVGGYTGLCPSESTSANRRMQGSITKHGKPRVCGTCSLNAPGY